MTKSGKEKEIQNWKYRDRVKNPTVKNKKIDSRQPQEERRERVKKDGIYREGQDRDRERG